MFVEEMVGKVWILGSVEGKGEGGRSACVTNQNQCGIRRD